MLTRGLTAKTRTGFQPWRGPARDRATVTPESAPFPTYKTRRKLLLPSLRVQASERASVRVLLQSSGRFGQLLLAAKAFAVAQVGRRCDPCLEAAANGLTPGRPHRLDRQHDR